MAEYNLGTASGKIVVDGSGAKAGFAVATDAANSFYSVIQARSGALEATGKTLVGIGTAGVAGFGLAVKTAASFEQQMSGVKAVTGASAAEMEAMSGKAMQLGADTAFSATESAQAIEELAKAGIPVEDILGGAADAAVALAAAGGIALPEAATIASNAMNQFGISATALPKVADILAGAANVSAADVSTLGQSLSQVGAVANLAGLSFRDTTIALGELANAGVAGSDAGTSLKSMLTNLIPTTDRQRAKFEELGLITYESRGAMQALAEQGIRPVSNTMDGALDAIEKYNEANGGLKAGSAAARSAAMKQGAQMGIIQNQFFDAAGDMKNLEQVQGTLSKAMAGLTKEEKLQSLELMFGTDALRAAAIMAENGAKGFNEFSTAMSKISAAEVAATRLDNLAGSFEQLKGSLDTLLIAVGSIMLPMIRFVVDSVTGMVNVFNSLPAPIFNTIGVVMALTSGLSLLLGALALAVPAMIGFVKSFFIAKTIGAVTTAIKIFYTAVKTGQGVMAAAALANASLGASFTALGAKGLLLGKTMRFLAVVSKAMLGPWGLIAAALVVAGIAAYQAYKNFEPFKNFIDSIPGPVKAAVVALAGMLIIGKIAAVWKGAGIASFANSFTGLRLAALGASQAFTTTRVTSGLLPATFAAVRAGVMGVAASFKAAILAISPWTVVIVAAIAIWSAWSGANAENEAAIEAVTETLDKQTGAITKNTEAWAAKTLQESGALDAAEELGISSEVVVAAAAKEKWAIDKLDAAYKKYEASKTGIGGGKAGPGPISDEGEAWNLLRGEIDGASGAITAAQRNKEQLDGALGNTGPADQWTAAIGRGAAAARGTTDSGEVFRGDIEATTGKIKEQISAVTALTGAYEKYATKMLEMLGGNIAFQAALDETRKAMDAENKTLDIGTNAGRENMEVLRSQATAAMDVGGSAEHQAAAINKSWEATVRFAKAMKLSGPEARALADRLHGIKNPADRAAAGLKNVGKEADKLDGKKDPKITPKVDGKKAQGDLRNVGKNADRLDKKKDPRINPKVNAKEPIEKIDTLAEKMQEIDSKKAEPKVNIDTKGADGAAKDVGASMNNIDRKVASPTVKVDTAAADGKIKGTGAKVDDLDKKKADPQVTIDANPALQSIQSIVSAFNSAMGGLQGSAASQGNAIGSALGSGIASGISNMTASIAAAAANAVTAAVSAARGAAQIKSPSRVMRDEVGVHLSTGIAEGIDRGKRSAEDSMRSMIASLAKNTVAPTNALVGVSGAGGGIGAPLGFGGGGLGGDTFVFHTYYPKRERTSDAIERTMTKMAHLGLRESRN